MADQIRERIREFIISNFFVANAPELSDTASLLDAGIVDSTGVLEVVSFLEQEFDIEVADRELLPENLDSIGSIAQFVTRKQGAPEALTQAS